MMIHTAEFGSSPERRIKELINQRLEVDEDMRQMQSESDTLRRKSQAAEKVAGSFTDITHPRSVVSS